MKSTTQLETSIAIWPSYDMAVAIEDSIDGVTHAFRSKEFELRKELIDAILDALGMRKPYQGFLFKARIQRNANFKENYQTTN